MFRIFNLIILGLFSRFRTFRSCHCPLHYNWFIIAVQRSGDQLVDRISWQLPWRRWSLSPRDVFVSLYNTHVFRIICFKIDSLCFISSLLHIESNRCSKLMTPVILFLTCLVCCLKVSLSSIGVWLRAMGCLLLPSSCLLRISFFILSTWALFFPAVMSIFHQTSFHATTPCLSNNFAATQCDVLSSGAYLPNLILFRPAYPQ